MTHAAPIPDERDPQAVGLVWIDERRAAIVRWDEEPTLEWIESGVPARLKPVGSIRRGPARPFGGGRVGGQGNQNRHFDMLRRFYVGVADRLADLERVEVIGRGGPEVEFAQLLERLSGRSRHGLIVSTESLRRRPSERQLAARLRKLVGRTLPRRTRGPYRPLPAPVKASGAVRPMTRADFPNRRPRRLPERREIDLEVEMMLAGEEPMR